jgi:ABC-type multidrug transport system ATPase subunit
MGTFSERGCVTMSHMTENAVEVEDLYFYYLTPQKKPLFPKLKLPLRKIGFEKSVALNHVNVKLRAGRTTALLGKNGSGKTTLIKLITGARFPQGGTVKVFGELPNKVRSRIGLCLGNTLVYHRLSGRENLEYFGRLYNVQNIDERIHELTSMLSLEDHLDQMVETYSFGMKAKLALARSMIHSPDLLILDEPTLGIDFQLAQQIRQFVHGLKCTVLLTTHYMEEAEILADDLCIIDQGNILEQGEKQEVLTRNEAADVGDLFTRTIDQPRLEKVAS